MPIHLVFALVLCHTTCSRASRVLFTLYALNLGAEPATVGVLAGTFAVFPMLMSWYAGKLTDRYSPRLLLLCAATVSACGLALPFFAPHLAAVFIAAGTCGLAATFYNLSLQNLVGRLVPTAKRARNYNNYTLAISIANAAGPLMAGICIDRYGYEATFLYVAAVMALPIVLFVTRGGVLPANKRESAAAGSIRDTLLNPKIWPVIAASSVAQTGLELFQVYMPVYGNQLGLSASAIGIIVAMCAIGGFASRIVLPRLIAWGSEERVLAYALLVGAFSFVVVPFLHSVVLLCAISLVFGCGVNCTQPIVMTLMHSRSPEGRAGEALGLRFALDNAVKTISPVIFGMIASITGVGAMFWINALLLGAGGVIAHFDAQKGRRAAQADDQATIRR